jgi:hypothetical protein
LADAVQGRHARAFRGELVVAELQARPIHEFWMREIAAANTTSSA